MQYKEQADLLLKQLFGTNAVFRDGQLEAILSVLDKKRTLVVQKTGWGKSLVYFIATKILRNQGYGPVILISPLLSLIRNQILNAEKLGLKVCSFNSENPNSWDAFISAIKNDECDIIMLAPEKLGNKEIMDNILSSISKGIGMFVIDEAHCISEWGHDFRPDFLRINNFIKSFSNNIPILATTATANDRVVSDIYSQLGEDTVIQRGPLIRESLRIQVIHLDSQEDRLTWLVENIKNIEGSGIIYCLTQKDCDLVSEWLNLNDISAQPYYSHKKIDRLQVENDFYNNKFKVIVATVALGMGYDKPDIKFVIHYQRPGSILSYYQQIGRAGRNLDEAYAVLLVGKEDDRIQENLINTAFPSYKNMLSVLKVIEEETEIKKSQILNKVNLKVTKIEQCLKFLEIANVISKSNGSYSRTVNVWDVNMGEKAKITEERYKELEEMNQYTYTKNCYMEFISNSLNDPYLKKCEKCANCTMSMFPETIIDMDLKNKAINWIKNQYLVIEPRSKYPDMKNIPKELINEIGYSLCMYSDSGYGGLVQKGKYQDGEFSDVLVDASFELLSQKKFELPFDFVVYVPSLNRPELVKSFAHRLANKFAIPCYDILTKVKNTPPQKTMENSAQQYKNISDCFNIEGDAEIRRDKCVLLVDDMFDSKWTLTICGKLLKEKGAKYVYPFTLACTAGKE